MTDKKHILVVDDDTSLLEKLGDLLEFEGYDVSTATDGEGGLKKLQTVSPDLIILDMNMPGMGGIGFLKALGADAGRPVPPVFVFTARASMEDFFDGLEVAGFMAKPCEPDVLLREVKRVLGAAGDREGGGKAAAAAGGKRILIAEDDAEEARRIARAFEKAGFDVESADSGPVALERVIGSKPDVVLAKQVLTGMNGDKLAAMLKEMPTTAAIPVVLYEDSSLPVGMSASTGGKGLAEKLIRSAESAELIGAVLSVLS
jgi:DNA-binding response OmpR family regulator